MSVFMVQYGILDMIPRVNYSPVKIEFKCVIIFMCVKTQSKTTQQSICTSM